MNDKKSSGKYSKLRVLFIFVWMWHEQLAADWIPFFCSNSPRYTAVHNIPSVVRAVQRRWSERTRRWRVRLCSICGNFRSLEEILHFMLLYTNNNADLNSTCRCFPRGERKNQFHVVWSCSRVSIICIVHDWIGAHCQWQWHYSTE